MLKFLNDKSGEIFFFPIIVVGNFACVLLLMYYSADDVVVFAGLALLYFTWGCYLVFVWLK